MCSISIVQVLMTFNVGLYESIGSLLVDPGDSPTRAERRAEIIKQLGQLKAHVICLQEVWYGEDANAIVSGLQRTFPFSYSTLHDVGGDVPLGGFDTSPPCDPVLLATYMNCLQLSCPAPSTDPLFLVCALIQCKAQLLPLSQECWSCMWLSGPMYETIAARCVTEVDSGLYQNMNLPGLLLLSTTEMSNKQYVDYHPGTRVVVERGYLKAEVSQIGEVVCTHTTSNSPIYFEPELPDTGITSYQQQSQVELTALINDFSSRDKVILLGDFNVGPAIPPYIEADFPENYVLMTAAFDHHVLSECTFCNGSENAYNAYLPTVVIDHVFYKGYKFQSSTRVLDGNDVSGLPLSDHYGVVQRFTQP